MDTSYCLRVFINTLVITLSSFDLCYVDGYTSRSTYIHNIGVTPYDPCLFS